MNISQKILFRRFLQPDDIIERVYYEHHVFLVKPMIAVVAVALLAATIAAFIDRSYFLPIFILTFFIGLVRNAFVRNMRALIFCQKHVIITHWNGVLDHSSVVRLGYEDVRGCPYTVQGIHQLVLGYGTIEIHRLGFDPVIFERIRSPKLIADLFHKKQLEISQSTSVSSREDIKNALSELLTDYFAKQKERSRVG
ncbi:MAG: hypothetical protein ACI9QC_000239 [Oceanicoccus sp.]|jgi:hypothetical protein